MLNLILIFIAAAITHNFVLTYFLGICPFIGVSGRLKEALGMGAATTFVMTMAATVTWLIYHFVLMRFGLPFLQYVSFIIVIASLVQIVEMFIDRYSPVLYVSLGVFLPLITVNCAILGVSLFAVIRDYSYLQCMAFALGSGIGWMLAIVAMAGIRQRLQFSSIPEGLKGPGITMIIAGIMAIAFMGFAGIVNMN